MTVHFENPIHFDNPDRAGILDLALCQQGQGDGGPELRDGDTITNDRSSIDCPQCLARQWLDAAISRRLDAALDAALSAAVDNAINAALARNPAFTLDLDAAVNRRPAVADIDLAFDAAAFNAALDAATVDGRMNAALDRWIESDHDRYFAYFFVRRPAAAALDAAIAAAIAGAFDRAFDRRLDR